ncbi:hypothetical protein C8J57DRAFT_1229107 [Mycena rebaudengoi]|nr:hypothetical protein C8J57DRAFT_1229107 [Mycena rebaudengoi]
MSENWPGILMRIASCRAPELDISTILVLTSAARGPRWRTGQVKLDEILNGLVDPDGTIILVEPTDDASPAFQDIRESNVTAVYDVVLTDMAQYGGYTDTEDSSIHYSINFPISSSITTCFGSLPTFVSSSLLLEVDYGPISGTQNQHVDWLKVADFPRDSQSYRVRWLQLLTQKDKSAAEVLEDAWMGPGNLWELYDRIGKASFQEHLLRSFPTTASDSRSIGSRAPD